MAIELYLKNDNRLECTVTFADTSQVSTAATVSAEIVERSDSTSVIETGLTLTQVDTDGTYVKLLDETLYTNKKWYTAQVTVLTSDNTDGYVEVDFQARTRRVF